MTIKELDEQIAGLRAEVARLTQEREEALRKYERTMAERDEHAEWRGKQMRRAEVAEGRCRDLTEALTAMTRVIGLYRSMVTSGETHSQQSDREAAEAFGLSRTVLAGGTGDNKGENER